MTNIVNYFNAFLELIFGSSRGVLNLQLLTPSSFVTYLKGIFYNSINGDLWAFIQTFFQHDSWMSILFSAFVWSWFAILAFKLLLVYPFKWFKSVVKRK